MATATNKAINEAQIRQLIDNWVKAVRANDIDPTFLPVLGDRQFPCFTCHN